MDFLIADTFTDSLARLTGDEQKAVKTTAFDLQLNPTNPGLSFHKLERARDKNFWSVRVNDGIRLIVHRTVGSLLLCYVGHHDKAYAWAERRKLEAHPKTGAAQLVEIRETVQEIIVPSYIEAPQSRPAKPPLFASRSEEELLGYGVPQEWLGEVRQATEDTLLLLADHLPAEAAEALLELATGGAPRTVEPVGATEVLFKHPDAQRRFRIIANLEEMQQALEYPWEKWIVFLHPEQRQWVERDYNGPARVSGSAGTGKTIVALHRAVFLARNHPEARILLTTFSKTLANALFFRLRRLVHHEPHLMEQLEVSSLNDVGARLYKTQFGAPNLIESGTLHALLEEASQAVGGHRFSERFIRTEWEQVVDAWNLSTWEAYRDVTRLGRRTRLPEPQRAQLWRIFEQVRGSLSARGLITPSQMFHELAEGTRQRKNPPFDFVIVDEAQDIRISQLRFLAEMNGNRPNGLFFAGDLGQRIFQQPFSWKALGVDIRGRSRTLRVNYRTSHQIRMQADRLLEPAVRDIDGNVEERAGTVSVFNGLPPIVRVYDTVEAESKGVAEWLQERLNDGVLPHECGVFVRSQSELPRAVLAVQSAGAPFQTLDDNTEASPGQISIAVMHLAKGLEYRAVVVMACDDEIIPLQERIETVVDDNELEEVYNTERHLLYVACTRARDHLLVTSVSPASEFLDDLQT